MSGDLAIRWSTAATVVGVGAIAAVVSYRHALEVVRAHGETGVTAQLVPLTVDGLVYTASMVLLDSARRGLSAPALARWALGMGIGATVAVNVLHGVAHGPVGAVIAAWPAVTLVAVVELLMGMIRRGRMEPVSEAVPGEVSAVPAPPDPHHVRAAEVFADDLARGHVPGIRVIKQSLRIGQPKAAQVRAYLSGLAAENGS